MVPGYQKYGGNNVMIIGVVINSIFVMAVLILTGGVLARKRILTIDWIIWSRLSQFLLIIIVPFHKVICH